MTVNLVTVTGNLETLAGATPSSGRLWFKLNRPDWNLSGDIFAPEYVEATANPSTGAFSVDLQSTTDLEGGASYSVVLKYKEPLDDFNREYVVARFMLPTGGPYQLGDLLTVPFVEPVPADILALCQAYALAAEDALEAIESKTPLATYTRAEAVTLTAAADAGFLSNNQWQDENGSGYILDGVSTLLPTLPGSRPVAPYVPTQFARTDWLAFTLGATGDFASFNEALEFYSKMLKSGGLDPDQECVVTTQAGFAMNEQVRLTGGDYSRLKFLSTDATVVMTRSALVTDFGDGFYNGFTFDYCITPKLQVKFIMDTSGTATNRRGIRGVHSRVHVNGGGVQNAANRGGVFYNSEVYASSSVWDGAGTIGFRPANR